MGGGSSKTAVKKEEEESVLQISLFGPPGSGKSAFIRSLHLMSDLVYESEWDGKWQSMKECWFEEYKLMIQKHAMRSIFQVLAYVKIDDESITDELRVQIQDLVLFCDGFEQSCEEIHDWDELQTLLEFTKHVEFKAALERSKSSMVEHGESTNAEYFIHRIPVILNPKYNACSLTAADIVCAYDVPSLIRQQQYQVATKEGITESARIRYWNGMAQLRGLCKGDYSWMNCKEKVFFLDITAFVKHNECIFHTKNHLRTPDRWTLIIDSLKTLIMSTDFIRLYVLITKCDWLFSRYSKHEMIQVSNQLVINADDSSSSLMTTQMINSEQLIEFVKTEVLNIFDDLGHSSKKDRVLIETVECASKKRLDMVCELCLVNGRPSMWTTDVLNEMIEREERRRAKLLHHSLDEWGTLCDSWISIDHSDLRNLILDFTWDLHDYLGRAKALQRSSDDRYSMLKQPWQMFTDMVYSGTYSFHRPRGLFNGEMKRPVGYTREGPFEKVHS